MKLLIFNILEHFWRNVGYSASVSPHFKILFKQRGVIFAVDLVEFRDIEIDYFDQIRI